MAGNINTGNGLSKYSRALLFAFAASLLFSIYLLSSLPSDLKFKANVQFMDLVNPVLLKLYLALGLTAAIAGITLYVEMRNKRTVIVYKEKTQAQTAEEKSNADTNRAVDALNSRSITAQDSKTILADALNVLAKALEAGAGACYWPGEANGQRYVELHSGFALPVAETDVVRFNLGEGMVGQVAKSGTTIFLDELPEGYFPVQSGLGQAPPKYVLVLPVKKGNDVKAVIEIATFKNIGQKERQAAEKFMNEIGERLS
jgi:hypothetical protein